MFLTSSLLTRLLPSSALFQEWQNEKSLTIDSTFYSNVEPCEVKALFGGVAKMQNKYNTQALVFGGAYHTALEAYYRGVEPSLCVDIALTEWRKSGVLADAKRNEASLDTLCTSYFQHQKVTGDHLKPIRVKLPTTGEEVDANEIAFKLQVGEHEGYKFFWKGKMDLIVKEGNDLWLVDHKTTSVMGEQFLDDKHRSNQMVGYTFACRHLFNLPVKGVLLNVAAIRSKGFEFQRFKLPIGEAAVYEWATEIDYRFQQLHALLLRLSATKEKMNFVSVNREACCTKYGKCTFFDVCQSLPQHREALLLDGGTFAPSTFDPLKA